MWIYRCGETACPEDWKPRVRTQGNRYIGGIVHIPVPRTRLSGKRESPFWTYNECGGAAILKDRAARVADAS